MLVVWVWLWFVVFDICLVNVGVVLVGVFVDEFGVKIVYV